MSVGPIDRCRRSGNNLASGGVHALGCPERNGRTVEVTTKNGQHFAALGACMALNELHRRLSECSAEARAEGGPIVDKMLAEYADRALVIGDEAK